jgi:hypothetical protein
VNEGTDLYVAVQRHADAAARRRRPGGRSRSRGGTAPAGTERQGSHRGAPVGALIDTPGSAAKRRATGRPRPSGRGGGSGEYLPRAVGVSTIKGGVGAAAGRGQPAPVPQAQAVFTPSAEALEQATAMADANDLPRCQQMARNMRRAGIDMPPGLLALAALKPELLGAASPANKSPADISSAGTR